MVKINLQGYSVEPITNENLNQYEDVFYCNTEYYMVTEGRAATKKDCEETLEYTVEGIPGSNHYKIGFFDQENPVACLFLIEGYPENDVLWLGLFLVHNRYKRRGIGTACIQSLIKGLRGTSTRKIRLSVQDNNVSGLSFWRRMGFSVIGITDCGIYRNLTMEYCV